MSRKKINILHTTFSIFFKNGNKFLLLILLLITISGTSQGKTEYFNTPIKRKEFSERRWKSIKQTMVKQAKGNAYAKGETFGKQDFEPNQNPESYYDYEEEDYEGEYAKNNGEHQTYYEEEEYAQNNRRGEKGYVQQKHNEKTGDYFSKNEKKTDNPRPKSNKKITVSPAFSWILYLLLAIFLGYIIYLLFVHTTLSEEGAKIEEENLEKPPIEIPKTELELMLEQALKEQNYRLAVRVYFIFILKELSKKQWIDWKKEKTNFTYLTEMRGKQYYNSFNHAVTVFEVVWYGKYNVSQEDYKEIEPRFKKLLTQLEQYPTNN